MEGGRRGRKQPSRKMEHTGGGGGEILKGELGESGLWMDLWILPFPPSLGAATAGPPEASRLPSQPKAITMRLRCYQLGATPG